MKPRAIFVQVCGPDYAPRFCLEDGQSKYWNDDKQTWVYDRRERTLWAHEDKIMRKQGELMLTEVSGTLQTFVVPLNIKVKSEQPVDIKDLQRWLDEAVQFGIDGNQHGTGPNDSMTMLEVCWDEIKETNESKEGRRKNHVE